MRKGVIAFLLVILSVIEPGGGSGDKPYAHDSDEECVLVLRGRQATAKMTGIPTSIGAQLLAHGEGHGTGVLAPEAAFDPTRFIAELARRDIRVEERIEEHGIIDGRFADALSRGYVATPVRVANDGKSNQL